MNTNTVAAVATAISSFVWEPPKFSQLPGEPIEGTVVTTYTLVVKPVRVETRYRYSKGFWEQLSETNDISSLFIPVTTNLGIYPLTYTNVITLTNTWDPTWRPQPLTTNWYPFNSIGIEFGIISDGRTIIRTNHTNDNLQR